MAENEQKLNDTELENVAGGIDKNNRRRNNECPKCYKEIRIYADAVVEGRGTKPAYTCESCRLKWIARSFYNNALVQHELISYEPVNGAHQVLGNYRDLRNSNLI